jgi:hypothetical protein
MILASVWKYRISHRNCIAHIKHIQIQAMSSDRKRIGQENQSNNNESN